MNRFKWNCFLVKMFFLGSILILGQQTICQNTHHNNGIKDDDIDTNQLTSIPILQPDKNFNSTRFYSGLGTGVAAYGLTVYGLSTLWYQDKTKTTFHFYNDWGQWRYMDKLGHAQTSYIYARWLYQGARWAGVQKNNSLWLASATSNAFQLTIEIFDGHFDNWGFSVTDISANILGTAIFHTQEAIWDEQRIYLKFSAFPAKIPNRTFYSIPDRNEILLSDVAKDKYGSTVLSQLLKNYNNQRYWISINPHSFLPDTDLPRWLNIAVGYGIENVYGGSDNLYTKDDILYNISLTRRSHYYISLDVDWERINWNNHFMKTLGFLLNSIKTPSPAIGIDSQGAIKVYLLFF